MAHTSDEQLMRRFLLGDLSDEERALVQDRAASDPGFFEELCAFEDDLVFRNLRGDLTGRDQELFIAEYASTPDRAYRLEEARVLLGAARRARATLARPTVWQRAREWLAIPRMVPTLAVAGAAALLLCTVPLALYSLSAFLGRGGAGPASGARMVAAFPLSEPGVRRGGTGVAGVARLRVPGDATDVRLDLDLGQAVAAADLAVDLSRLDGGGAVAASEWRLADGDTVLVLSVPAADLPDGDYTLTARRRNSDGPDLAAAAFRVTRE